MYRTVPASDAGEAPMRADRLQPALQPRILGRAGLVGAHNFRALLLESGQAALHGPTGEMVMNGPVVAWLPWRDGMRLRIAPGARGLHVALGPALLGPALRHNPAAAELGYMAERQYVLPLDHVREAGARALRGSFLGLLAETESAGPMSAALVDAHLSVLLIVLYRGLKAEHYDLDLTRMAPPLASRFISLVEAHLGDRWTVARYAATLDVSRDRLHDICLRAFGRAPGLLIRLRVAMEARRLLEQSTLSVDQIAARLGFGSASQFSRAFKAVEGAAPGQYRRRTWQPGWQRDRRQDLHAWP